MDISRGPVSPKDASKECHTAVTSPGRPSGFMWRGRDDDARAAAVPHSVSMRLDADGMAFAGDPAMFFGLT